MNRKFYVLWHIGMIAGLAFWLWLFKTNDALAPDRDLSFFKTSAFMAWLCSFLLLWLIVLLRRLANMGFPWWLCYLNVLVLFWIPIPGIRLIPWGGGFFIPPGLFAGEF